MKANELMIGDFVQVPSLIDNVEHYDAWCKVKQLRDCDLDVIGFKELKYNEVMPIPVTREILEKFGFQQISTNKYVSDKVTIAVFAEEFLVTIKSENAMVMMITVKYVHELQHVLQLCGIEKEIGL